MKMFIESNFCMERSIDSCMERSNSCMGRSDYWWGRNDHGAKWPDTKYLRPETLWLTNYEAKPIFQPFDVKKNTLNKSNEKCEYNPVKLFHPGKMRLVMRDCCHANWVRDDYI